MGYARMLMEARIISQPETGRTIEICRPGQGPWYAGLPAELDQGNSVPELANYLTIRYLQELPKASLQLGWETIYALVRLSLIDAEDEVDFRIL
jgi:hypothetical protein